MPNLRMELISNKKPLSLCARTKDSPDPASHNCGPYLCSVSAAAAIFFRARTQRPRYTYGHISWGPIILNQSEALSRRCQERRPLRFSPGPAPTHLYERKCSITHSLLPPLPLTTTTRPERRQRETGAAEEDRGSDSHWRAREDLENRPLAGSKKEGLARVRGA